ncbi:MAG: Co2+/Mg2+ efflux protein ApaG [Bacteroidia bacterium]|nr:Co2+/Mg2+ efflux protein ApaG [Bacteroidia bacterium]
MNKLTTNGVTVAVEMEYAARHSEPAVSNYVFSYHITIINEGMDTIQLLSRHWRIFDAIGDRREVKGDGVIGEQPILKPGDIHRYRSWCPLKSEIGQMRGSFQMINLESKESFDVKIPAFDLLTPAKEN